MTEAHCPDFNPYCDGSDLLHGEWCKALDAAESEREKLEKNLAGCTESLRLAMESYAELETERGHEHTQRAIQEDRADRFAAELNDAEARIRELETALANAGNEAYRGWIATDNPPLRDQFALIHTIARRALSEATKREELTTRWQIGCPSGLHANTGRCDCEATKREHPCPKGDDCALNRGAVTCKACGRNWPPDETWATKRGTKA